MDRPLVVLDTENAALQGAPHLVELGAVRVVDGEIEDTFESLVRPSVPIDPEVSEIHGIREDDVRDAPDAAEVLTRFGEWAGDDWLAAHNSGADAHVLGFEYARHGLTDEPTGPFLDSLALARKHIPESPDHKLATLSEHLELEDSDRHRALADAVTCWKVIEECMERAGGLDGLRMAEWLAQSGTPITITGRRPGEPRVPRRARRLVEATRNSEEIQLLYGDSASPPARLSVLPRFLYERHQKGYLEAECLSSGMLKTYLLGRVQRVLEPR